MVEENKVVVVACSANVFLCNIYKESGVWI
jgi:hypothetical protein